MVETEVHGFICYYCKEVCGMETLKPKTLRFVKKDGVHRGKCIPCHREYSRNYAINKRSVLMPQNFMECDDCDRTFSKYADGAKNSFHHMRKLRICCPFCESEEILGLTE